MSADVTQMKTVCLWIRCTFVAFILVFANSSVLQSAEETNFIDFCNERGEPDKVAPIDPQLISRFAAKEFVYDSALDYSDDKGPFHQRRFRYRLHEPEVIEPGKLYPLIVWLHGCGDERGWDNRSQLLYLDKTVLRIDDELELRQFYVLAPQSPLIPGAPGVWHFRSASPITRLSKGQEDEMLSVVMDILDKTLADNPIDSERVVLVGISCAANACLELGVRYPDRWAGLALLSLGHIPDVHMSALPTCPIWIFNNHFDEYMTPDHFNGLQQRITLANNLGADIAHTIIRLDDWKHDSWTPAFQQYELLTWLLQQRRGKYRLISPPGIAPSNWPWKQPLRNWSAIQLWAQLSLIVAIIMIPTYAWARRAFFRDVLLSRRTSPDK
jgi:predicted esterase